MLFVTLTVALGVAVAVSFGMVSVGTGTGGLEEAIVGSAFNAAAVLDEEREAQPIVPPASSAVKARPGHRADRARALATLVGFAGAGTSGDVA